MTFASVGSLGVSRKTLLTRALFAVTIVPLLFYVCIVPFFAANTTYKSVLWAIGVVGVTHVGMTAYFYAVDRRYSEIIGADKTRYYILPALVILGALVAFLTFTNQQLFWYFIVHYSWLLWHFNRQNYGLYAMFLRSEGQRPMSALERRLFDCLCVGAVPVALTLNPVIGKGMADWSWELVLLGRMIFIACAGSLCFEAFRQGRHKSRLCSAWLALSILFFVPTVVALNSVIALAFYAHPFQYIVMMLFVASAEDDRLPFNGLARMAAAAVIGVSLYVVIATFQNGYLLASDGSRVALAIAYGFTQWHFLADAGLWRMRDAGPRKNFEESFAFMFQRLK